MKRGASQKEGNKMKRNKKMLAVLITLMIASASGVAGTIYHASTSTSTTMQGPGGTPPDMNNGSDSNSQNNQNNNSDSDSNSDSSTDSDSNSSTDSTAESTTNSSDSSQDSSNSQSGTPPQMPSNGQNGMPSNMSSTKQGLTPVHIVIISGCLLVFTASGLLLIFTKNGKLAIKTALQTNKKKVIYGATTVLVTSALAIGTVAGTKALIGSKGSSQPQISENQSTTSSSDSSSATGAVTVSKTSSASNKTISATKSDQSAVLVKGGTYTLTDSTLTKTGDESSNSNSEFTGTNAGALVTKGTLKISNSSLTTDAAGANGLFAYGSSSKIVASNVTITTTKDKSRGLDATNGGKITATKMTITTSGAHSAALATDRGGGTVTVSDSTLSTSGEGSPMIYSTGKITLKNSTGTATGSSAVVIEGKNSATITNSKLTTVGLGRANGGIDNAGVMIYQSTSGDASEGTGTFTAKNSSITIDSSSSVYTTSPMFFVTNTSAVINLNNTDLVYGSNIILKATGNDEWGKSGSNGGKVTLNATNQTLTGNIVADSISTVTLNLKSSTLTSTVNGDNSAKKVTVKLDANSTWNLTGNSYVTTLTLANNDISLINSNGYNIYYSKSANSWLNGQTISLNGGGSLIPVD